ncbi:hypothetical protein [Nocardioides zhouii]|uniref:Uncharacterized protein n=1 Tax=Nocardioides zhouii TaxID=1168729 RepID=A0A4Q2SWL4_9ACTN|nr:hypothetical protein [Nocardioides zhouii]RYC10495.1 hypothetical protein EUA94_13295 [Nocardioides zhouii]
MAVVLGRRDDASARRVVERFGKLELPVRTDYWSHDQFFDAASQVDALAGWAADLRRRYTLPE